MFDVAEEAHGPYKKYWLIDQLSEAKIGVVPAVGATITDMHLSQRLDCTDILAGYSCHEDLTALKGFRSSKLLPFPNRVANARYTFGGQSFQLPVNRPKEGNAIHGLVYDQVFHTDKISASPDEAAIIMHYRYDGSVEGYPFPFMVSLKYTLQPGSFKVTTTVRNTGSGPMPFGDGWHPYFRLDGIADDWHLQLPACKEILLNSEKVPVGAIADYDSFHICRTIDDTKLDTCLLLNPSDKRALVRLCDGESDFAVYVWQETGEHKYNFLQLYIPPDRKSIAIEPMTCAPNAFNNGMGLIVLEPDGVFEASYGVFLSEA